MQAWTGLVAGVAVIAGAIPMYGSGGLSFWDMWLSLWAVAFFVGFVLIALEGAFFMKSPEIQRISQFVMAFIATGAVAAAATALLSANTLEFTLYDKCRELLAGRSVTDWIVRLAGAGGLYAFLYAACGSAAWPFVREYYRDPESALALHVPSGRVVILLQMLRGLLTTIALVPLIAARPALDFTWWLRLGLLLAVVMAVGPLVMATRWPSRLRRVHAIEISVFAVLYSLVVWWLIPRSGAPA